MRPIKLVMTGFESYKNKTEINFEEFGTKGLYLITGDTGAGKTTIFDAITFALYGLPSGKDRSVYELRSDFADETIPTKVELDFEANGKKYRVERNPDYERKAIRGEGTTKEAANALLKYLSEDKIPVSGVSKVSAEIKNILHLDKDQFCSIAMIAQGNFQKLLTSDKKEKSKIFRELFHTEKYEELQNTLKSEKSNAESNVKNLRLQLNGALLLIDVKNDDENAEEIKKIKTSEYVTENEIQILKEFISKDEKKLAKIIENIKKVDDSLEKVNKNLQIAQNRKNLTDEIEKAKNDLEIEKANLKICIEKLNEANKNAEQVPELEKSKTLLEESLKDYEEIKNSSENLKKLSENIFKDNSKLEFYKSEKEKIEKSINDLKTERDQLKNAGEKIGTYEAELKQISDKQKNLQEIKIKLNSLAKDEKNLAIAQKNAREAVSNFEAENQNYVEKLHLFNMEQAGILAATLQKGEKCPVCGSTNHPFPAQKSENAPSQIELENSKNKADKLQKISSELSLEAGQKKAFVDSSKKLIDDLLKNHFENFSSTDDFVISKIDEKLEECKNQENEVNKKLFTEQKNKNRRNELENQIPEFEKSLKQKETDISTLTSKISGENAELKTKSEELNEKKSKLKYETYETAKKELTNLTNNVNSLKKSVENATNNLNNCNIKIGRLDGSIKGFENQLEKTPPVYEFELKNEKDKLTEQKKLLSENRDSLNNRKGKNSEGVFTAEKLVPEIAKAKAKLEMISALHEVAVGTNHGKNGRPSIETYVQMRCLDQINRRANMRFKKMTGDKYELRRRIEEDGAELGLDLNVKDFYTGRERNVKSLSGGEQFQASLSLALGLADEVQENSGGIKLDAMFIDEGFGTLDSETLNKAMRALEDLSQGNKLVGIISHVEELESRIPLQISVKKDDFGVSHAKMIKD